jgi:hypothetical protein
MSTTRTTGINIHGDMVNIGVNVRMQCVEYVGLGLTTLILGDEELACDCVRCYGNHLTELKIPDHIRWLHCDPDLFKYDECKVHVVHIYYE